MMKVSQLRVLVDDFTASYHFYHHVLGLEPQSANQESGPYACFEDPDGGADVALFERRFMAASIGAPYPERGTADHAVLVFRVDDVDDTYAKAVAAGATSVAEPTARPDWGLRSAHLRAPEGTLIELCAY
ncbi:VOC family protein [Actinospica durhamensis]|uniref:VOC family protein n=1 Tax=Actinospica durhamensis TaxID=1508375 RepID=A0A941ELT0_9ACTN|nr:VOC family protein [Actinospica durhamensis]MBR7832897.1 VOC family protein [Actinospica durhamensis]